MSGELIEQLSKKKRAIDAETARLESEYLQLHQNHRWVLNEDLAEDFPSLNDEDLAKQQTLLALQLSLFRNQLSLKRADFFGPRYTRSLVPTLCITCFIDQNSDSLMVEVESDRGNGIRQFECPVCKHVLRVAPV